MSITYDRDPSAPLGTPEGSALAPGMAPEGMSASITADVERRAAIAAAAEERSAAAAKRLDEVPPDTTPPEVPASLLERIGAENRLTMRRSPSDWESRTITLGAQAATQLAGRRPFRETVVVFNPSAAVTLYAALPNVGVTPRGVALAVDASLSLDTEGPVYAAGALGTTVSVVETFDDPSALVDAVRLLAREVLRGKVRETV